MQKFTRVHPVLCCHPSTQQEQNRAPLHATGGPRFCSPEGPGHQVSGSARGSGRALALSAATLMRPGSTRLCEPLAWSLSGGVKPGSIKKYF